MVVMCLLFFTTFLNILFDDDYESDSSDYQSCFDEDFLEEIFSNPLFEEEIIPMRIDQHHFNAESDLLEAMLNLDSSIIYSSSKIDSLLDEFAEEFVSKNSNAKIESFSPSPIPIKDSDSFMEEIDLTFTMDDPMSPSIEDDDDDSEGDNIFLERLLHDDPIPLPDTLDFSYDVRVFLLFFTYPCGTFKKFNTHRSHLNESPMEMLFSTYTPLINSSMGDLGQAKRPKTSASWEAPNAYHLLHLAGSKPMLKSSYKAEASVIISIPPLVGGVADVVVEIKGTDENPIRTLGDYSKPSHEGYMNTIELPVGNNMAPLQSDTIRLLCDRNAKESWALLEDLALYDNESWNDPRDFAKPVKAIAFPQDVPSTFDRCLIELENQVQRLMEAYLASTQPTQVNKVSSLCEICNGPQDTQYCMENLEQAFVDYASSRTNEVGGKRLTPNQGPKNFNYSANTWKDKPNFNWERTQIFTSPQNGSISTHSSIYQMKLEKALLHFDSHQERRLSHLRTQLRQQQDDMIGKINLLSKIVFEKFNDVTTP
nr:hypothetical protein [Tanacetum cinerariifolium]